MLMPMRWFLRHLGAPIVVLLEYVTALAALIGIIAGYVALRPPQRHVNAVDVAVGGTSEGEGAVLAPFIFIGLAIVMMSVLVATVSGMIIAAIRARRLSRRGEPVSPTLRKTLATGTLAALSGALWGVCTIPVVMAGGMLWLFVPALH
jgi:hypothetical protein